MGEDIVSCKLPRLLHQPFTRSGRRRRQPRWTCLDAACRPDRSGPCRCRSGGRAADQRSSAMPGRPSSARWASRFVPAPTGDDTLARWFHQADRNRDAMLTRRRDAGRRRPLLREARHQSRRRDRSRGARSLTNGRSPRKSRSTRNGGRPAAGRHRQAAPNGAAPAKPRRGSRFAMAGWTSLQGAARYSLLNLPQPVAAADTDFNRAITAASSGRRHWHRFQLLDGARLGKLTLHGLATVACRRRPRRCRPKRDEKDADTRIGLPLPPRD